MKTIVTMKSLYHTIGLMHTIKYNFLHIIYNLNFEDYLNQYWITKNELEYNPKWMQWLEQKCHDKCVELNDKTARFEAELVERRLIRENYKK